MKFVLRPAVWLIATGAILAAACDRDSPPKDGGDQGGDSPIVLRGGERLGWDQPIAFGANPATYTYALFIDGFRNTLTNVTCGISGSAGFTCASPLPSMSVGRHSLSLVAAQGADLSAPSRSLEVTVLVATVIVEETVRLENDTAQPRCSPTDGPCYRSIEIVRSPGLVSSPVSALNRRILFVVDGRQIQAVSPTSASPSVLLTVKSSSERILSIAAPSSGPDGGSLVWATSVETRVDDTSNLTITRYRLVGDTLGEAAVVVSMSIPDVEPRVVVDNAHIYIAMPSTRATRASVWRLMTDGTTPRSQASPELSSGAAELGAIALAPEGQLWISSQDVSGRWQLGPIESADFGARFRSVAPAAGDHPGPGSGITSFAFTRGAVRSASSVFAVSSGTLYRASVEGSALGSMNRLPVSRGTPIEVAADDGGIFVVTGTPSNQSVVYSLLKLIP